MNINATIIGQSFTFVLFVLFCMKYVWPPLITAIEKRQKEIADGLAFVEQEKKVLDLARSNIDNQLKKANQEAQMLIDQARSRYDQILSEAKNEAEKERIRIITQAQVEIDVNHERIREELRKQIANLAISCAEKIIERSIDKDTSNNIIDKFIAELDEIN